MNQLLLFVLLALAFAAGLLWPRNLKRRRNPAPHRLADDWYFWTRLNGESHAFTDDQIRDARDRAVRLERFLERFL